MALIHIAGLFHCAVDGPDLVLSGSISLTSVQLGAGLTDEVILIVYPVSLGGGKYLLSDV